MPQRRRLCRETGAAFLALTPSRAMDPENRALCYFYRNPPVDSGVKRISYAKIAKMVVMPGRGENGEDVHPSPQAVCQAVQQWGKERATRGRKKGWRKTSRAEDKSILHTFKEVRKPLGKKVKANMVRSKLPVPLRKKVSVRTVRRRLAEAGVKPKKKKRNSNRGPAWMKRRKLWCEAHQHRSPGQWAEYVQAVADFRNFSFHPRRLKTKFTRFSASWTYMTKEERDMPEFALPDKVYTKEEYKYVKKGKVFGLTLSTGKHFVWVAKDPFKGPDFAKLVRARIGPALREAFPDRPRCRLLIDGEKLMHTPEAKAALRDAGVQVLANWPAHSPDLNPQENMWPWLEDKLRSAEKPSDTFKSFKVRLRTLARGFPDSVTLIPSLHKRVAECLKRKGGATGF